MDTWLRSNTSKSIEIRKSDARTDVSFLPDFYGELFQINGLFKEPITTRDDISPKIEALISWYQKQNNDSWNQLFRTNTAIQQFEAYLANLKKFQEDLLNMERPIPHFIVELEKNLELFLQFLKQSNQPISAHAFINFAFELAQTDRMLVSDLEKSFADFFNDKTDFAYADASWYFRTILDQNDPATRVTVLIVGDAHRKNLTNAFLETGYQLEKRLEAFRELHTSQGLAIVPNFSMIETICSYLASLGYYLIESAKTDRAPSFTDFCDSFMRKQLEVQKNSEAELTVTKKEENAVQACSNPTCNKSGTKRCGDCKSAFYCSIACQKKHWKQHKEKCCKKEN